MLSVIRKNQHFLTFIIVFLTIISFIWFFNRTNLSQVGANDVATLYGRVIQRAEIEREVRDYRLAVALGLTDFVRDLGGFAENEEVALTSFIFNVLVIQHEAPRLHVVPTDENVAMLIQQLPLFQTDGVFDSAKYATFLQEQLIPRGFTERHLEEVVRDSLTFQKLQELIAAPIVVSEAQVREAARVSQPVIAQVLRFDRDHYLTQKITITPEEKKAFYEKNKTFFVTEEERAVNYLLFTLPPNQQKLEGKERVKAMQQLSDKASAFQQQSQEAQQQGKTFEENAAKHGLKPIVSENFKKQESADLKKEKKGSIPPELVPVSFRLAKVGATSEVIQSGSNFYLVSLSRIVPARTLTLAEADSKIEKIVRTQKAAQQVQEAANKAYKALQAAMAAGKSFSQAVAALGQKSIPLSGTLNQASAKRSPEEQQSLLATLSLKEGEMSEVLHAPWGDFIVYLQQRLPLSNADWEAHHATIEQELLTQQRHLLFFEWLRQARAEAKITMLDGHHRRSLFSSIFGR